MAHTFDPGDAHQAFMRQLHEVNDRFEGALPPTHRLAIASQFLGQLIAGVDEERYGLAEIQQVVALNIERGNKSARGERVGSAPLVGHS